MSGQRGCRLESIPCGLRLLVEVEGVGCLLSALANTASERNGCLLALLIFLHMKRLMSTIVEDKCSKAPTSDKAIVHALGSAMCS